MIDHFISFIWSNSHTKRAHTHPYEIGVIMSILEVKHFKNKFQRDKIVCLKSHRYKIVILSLIFHFVSLMNTLCWSRFPVWATTWYGVNHKGKNWKKFRFRGDHGSSFRHVQLRHFWDIQKNMSDKHLVFGIEMILLENFIKLQVTQLKIKGVWFCILISDIYHYKINK